MTLRMRMTKVLVIFSDDGAIKTESLENDNDCGSFSDDDDLRDGCGDKEEEDDDDDGMGCFNIQSAQCH